MRTPPFYLLISVFFLLPSILQAEEPLALFQVRQVIADDTPGAEKFPDGTGVRNAPYAVAKEVLLDASDLQSVRAGVDHSGHPQVLISLTESSRQAWARTTQESLGKQLAIIVDGQVLLAPVLQSPIPGGQIAITGNYSTEEVQAIAAKLQRFTAGE